MSKIEKVNKVLEILIGKLNLKDYLQDLKNDKNFLLDINSQIKKNNIFKKKSFSSIFEFSVYRNFIYLLIRNKKPKYILETGVLHGLTSAWILKAIHDNGFGKLISIDLPMKDWKTYFGNKSVGPGGEADYEINNEESGWIIPEKLRKNWKLFLGPSSLHLPKVIRDYQNVDLFIHDSDHSYEVMSYECDLISKEYSAVDIIIDDFSYNKYYLDYKKKTHKDFFLINDIDDNLNEVKKSVYFPFVKKTTY